MSRAPRSQAARRSWGDDDSATPIIHVDMDAFFASVELLEHPELAGRPVIVGGRDGRGVVSAASYEARAFGVSSAMSMAEASRRCPQAVVLPVRHGFYSQVSAQVMAVLAEVTPALEKVSIDEAFLDVSGARRRMGSPVIIGRWIRAEIRRRVGVPASVGIASTKFIAKLASSHAKPDGLLLVPAASTQDFLNVLPVGALWGVGTRTQEVLARWGIQDVRTLAETDVRHLERILGRAAGRHLHDLSHGVDPCRVEPVREEKSVGTETTFFENLTDREHARRVLLD
ncbi:MAG: DNA polymerase IV, partial [Actinomyces sp.]